jgi:hypothetical protein
MEHRCSIRIPIKFDAVVHCRQVGTIPATIRDVGLGGMFVETGSTVLRPNTPVDLTTRVPQNGADKLHCLRAWVVWTGRRGAGLMLRSFDDATSVVLRTLVFGSIGFLTTSGARASTQSRAAEIGKSRSGEGTKTYPD